METPPSENRVTVVDSHTAGEPTRVVVAGGPVPEGESMGAKRDDFAARHGSFRSAVIGEPRGNDVMVGALGVEPCGPGSAAGVIFFNNAGCLGMCGHGLIGFVVTLAHLGRIGPGCHRIETPVGTVAAVLEGKGTVSFENVPCYREAGGVVVGLDGGGQVRGDVAWGGNWFFITADCPVALERENVAELSAFAARVRKAVNRTFPQIDHIELTSPPRDGAGGGRSFVLCPGLAYDRSPCGTGTCAKMACLHADGKLAPGEVWRQEGILGTVFEGSVRVDGDHVVPTVRGEAFVTAEASLLFDRADPFCWGIS